MSEQTRRDLLRELSLAVLGSVPFDLAAAQQVHHMAAEDSTATGGDYKPKKFNAHEFATLSRLSDLIIPMVSNSSGALAKGAPAWIDMLAASNAQLAQIYTEGLAHLDASMQKRCLLHQQNRYRSARVSRKHGGRQLRSSCRGD